MAPSTAFCRTDAAAARLQAAVVGQRLCAAAGVPRQPAALS